MMESSNSIRNTQAPMSAGLVSTCMNSLPDTVFTLNIISSSSWFKKVLAEALILPNTIKSQISPKFTIIFAY